MHSRVMRTAIATAALLVALAWTAPAASATHYVIDPDHSSVGFKIRHIFTKVRGRFDKFSGTVDYDPAHPGEAKVSGTIDVDSIDTDNEKRDKHLRSGDFFDVTKFPQITFVSTRVSHVDAAKQTGQMSGMLTMHGVSKPVVLDVAYLGTGKDILGKTRASFSGATTIKRSDFGISYNKVLETGGLLLGDDVTIELEIEGVAAE